MSNKLVVGLTGFILYGCFVGSPLAFAETREEAQRRLEKRIAVLSAATSVTKTLADLAALGDALEEHFASQILAAPREHRQVVQSKQLAHDEGIPKFIDMHINNAISEAIKLQSSLTRAEIMAAVSSDGRAKTAHAISSDIFEARFTKARRRAVEQQLGSLETEVKAPSFAEVNKRLTENQSWAAHENTLRNALRQSASVHQEATYEENSKAIDRLVDKSIAAVKAEYEYQIRFVDTLSVTDVPQDAIFETEIKDAISTRLKADLQQLKARYSLFDVAAKRLAEKSKELEAARCIKFIETAAIAFPTDDELRARINANLKMHQEPAASNRQLTAEFGEFAMKSFAEKYLQEVANPNATVQRRVKELFSADTAKKAIERRLHREITPGTQRARSAITSEQLKQFAKLRSMKPTEKQIEARYDAPSVLDYEGIVRIIGEPLPELDTLLVETISAVIQEVEKAFKAPVAELREQMQALKSVEKELQSDLLLDVAANVPKDEIMKKWVKRLLDLVKPAEGKLFSRTSQDVNKIISQHYTTIQRELAERQAKHIKSSIVAMSPKQEDKTTATRSSTSNAAASGGGSASGAGSGGSGADGTEAADGGNPEFVGDGEPPHGTITFSANSTGRVVATADFCDRTVAFAPAEVDASARQLTAVFADQLVALRAKTKPQKPNDPLRIALVVGTEDVRHLMTIRFRLAVSRRIAGPVVWADSPRR